MKNIAIIGAGGFGKEVACIINKINETKPTWKLVGFFDDGMKNGSQVSHFGKILGNTQDLNLWKDDLSIVFAIGNPKIIKMIVSSLSNKFLNFPNLIHPEVFFADEKSLCANACPRRFLVPFPIPKSSNPIQPIIELKINQTPYLLASR